jgi:hypothetical protein
MWFATTSTFAGLRRVWNSPATMSRPRNIVQTRFDRGLRQLAVLQARPSDLTAAILDARSRMAILRGTYSEEIAPEWRRRRGIPRIPDYVRPGRCRSICCGVAPIFAKPNAKSPRRRRGSARPRPTCSPPYRSPPGSAPKGGPASATEPRTQRRQFAGQSGQSDQAATGLSWISDAWMPLSSPRN